MLVGLLKNLPDSLRCGEVGRQAVQVVGHASLPGVGQGVGQVGGVLADYKYLRAARCQQQRGGSANARSTSGDQDGFVG